ncbi:unnamed protein product, partial [Mesorhabditis belari]|uniref:C-type lectin domain-containing protein n=1 Tax=Mesorhabditis belari TaxID=2138241 RepID=A0AAF3JB92_9BILA
MYRLSSIFLLFIYYFIFVDSNDGPSESPIENETTEKPAFNLELFNALKAFSDEMEERKAEGDVVEGQNDSALFDPLNPCAHFSGNWTHFNGSCYKKFHVDMMHAASKALCERKNAKLASIHSQEEQDFVFNAYGHSWIGLEKVNGTWTWSDGSAMDYTNWGYARWGEDQATISNSDTGFWSESRAVIVTGPICRKSPRS